MRNRKLKEFAQQRGWTIGRRFAYGEEQGYLVTLADGPSLKAFRFPLSGADQAQSAAMLDFIQANRDRLKVWDVLLDGTLLSVRFMEDRSDSWLDDMGKLLAAVVGRLRDVGIAPDNCHLCGQGQAKEKACLEETYSCFHPDCLSKALKEANEAHHVVDDEKKNYLVGTFGALVGAFLCSLPWFFVQFALEMIGALLAFLVGRGAFRFYTLLGGKIGRRTKWIILWVTLFTVLYMQFFVVFAIFSQNRIPVRLESFPMVYLRPDVTRRAVVGLGVAVIMSLLGIVAVFRDLGRADLGPEPGAPVDVA